MVEVELKIEGICEGEALGNATAVHLQVMTNRVWTYLEVSPTLNMEENYVLSLLLLLNY